MSSIVKELQLEALNDENSLSNLLRKAYLISKELELLEFEKWVRLESYGYRDYTNEEIPQYRKVYGEVKIQNYSNDWLPFNIKYVEILSQLDNIKLFESVSQLENSVKENKTDFQYIYSQEIQNILNEHSNVPDSHFCLSFDKSEIIRILNTVRNILIEWTHKLLKEGITGEGSEFTQEEKTEAKKHIYQVNYYFTKSNVHIEQNSPQVVIYDINIEEVKELVSNVQDNVNKLGLKQDSIIKIEEQLQNISKQLESNEPNSNVITNGLQSVKRVIEGGVGGVVANQLIENIDSILSFM